MKVRKSKIEDLEEIIEIIDQGKAYLKSQGINQWQDGNPNRETILKDIQEQISYVVDENCVIATMRFSIEEDPDYGYIEGSWKTNGPYGVMHRVAVCDSCKGKSVAKVMLDYAIACCKENHVHSLRIDTHVENLSMRRFIEKNHFEECGFVYIRGTEKRIAYELLF